MNRLFASLTGISAAMALASQAWSQPIMIWDRSYNDLPYMTTADVQISDSDGLLIVGQANQDAVYRVVEPDGFNSLYLTLRTNSFQSSFHAVYPIADHRLFVQCNSCWVQSGDNVTRLYSATENGLGGYVVPPGRFGYAIPMQVQQDGAIVGGAARHTTGSRHGWVADKWRWGATVPEWSSIPIMATVDGQTSGGFFPSNMRVNRTDRLLPAGSVLIDPNSPFVRQPFWFALTPTGAPLWTQRTDPLRHHGYFSDEDANQYFIFALEHSLAVSEVLACRFNADGSLGWSRRLGRHYGYANRAALARNEGEFWVIRHETTSDNEWVMLSMATGEIVRRVPVPLFGRSNQGPLWTHTDEFGAVYVAWKGWNGPIDYPSNERVALVKHDSAGRPIWVWEAHAHPSDFVGGHFVMRGGIGYFVSVGAQRIIKFRIRAAFAEGDASRDGCIDDKDLAMTLEAYGTNDPTADFDSNGLVNDRDLERVIRNFGLGCAE